MEQESASNRGDKSSADTWTFCKSFPAAQHAFQRVFMDENEHSIIGKWRTLDMPLEMLSTSKSTIERIVPSKSLTNEGVSRREAAPRILIVLVFTLSLSALASTQNSTNIKSRCERSCNSEWIGTWRWSKLAKSAPPSPSLDKERDGNLSVKLFDPFSGAGSNIGSEEGSQSDKLARAHEHRVRTSKLPSFDSGTKSWARETIKLSFSWTPLNAIKRPSVRQVAARTDEEWWRRIEVREKMIRDWVRCGRLS